MANNRVILQTAKAKKAIKKINREYRKEFQEIIQVMLDEIRFESIKFIIPNNTGVINPDLARRGQKSTPGKLTERTGKLIFMLKHRAKPFGEGFSGSRSKKKVTAGLVHTVQLQRKGGGLEAYRGKITYKFSNHGRLTSVGNKQFEIQDGKRVFPKLMPRENSRTLFFRFLHDRQGIRGKGKRPFLTPSAKENVRDFKSLASRRLTELLSRL